MKDYWKDLSLRETWSKQERFNFIMNYIDEKFGDSTNTSENNTPSEPEPETVTIADITVSVKNTSDKGISGATVTVSQEGSETTYTGNTGSAGGCTIRDVPLGSYTISTDATGYISSIDDFTVNSGENIFEVILETEVDDNV